MSWPCHSFLRAALTSALSPEDKYLPGVTMKLDTSAVLLVEKPPGVVPIGVLVTCDWAFRSESSSSFSSC